jgi:hypothetical protein
MRPCKIQRRYESQLALDFILQSIDQDPITQVLNGFSMHEAPPDARYVLSLSRERGGDLQAASVADARTPFQTAGARTSAPHTPQRSARAEGRAMRSAPSSCLPALMQGCPARLGGGPLHSRGWGGRVRGARCEYPRFRKEDASATSHCI